ncbi:MAG: VCBS repeat-containing protein [Bacteroidota bacterium]
MRILVCIVTIILAGVSCQRINRTHDVLLTLLPPSFTGVEFINHLEETEEFNIIEYLYFNNGAGVAAGDINNDGLQDLYFTSNQNSNKLYLNKGNLQFEDITERAGVSGVGDWSTGVSMADVNGDGFLDIYLCQVEGYKGLEGHNQLYINQGDLSFVEEAAHYGIDFRGFSTQAAFFDHDLDGDLDMYLLNHSVHTSRSYGSADLRNETDARAGDRLFRNNLSEGIAEFTDITRESGIYSSQIGYGLGINVSDLNNDGYPDIYISNDFHENDYLYINNGDGSYTERLNQMIAHTSRSSMGNDVADFNNDGLMDIFVLDMLPDDQKIRMQSGGEDDPELFSLKLYYGYSHQFVRNTLQLNMGDGMFSEIGRMAGVYSTDWSWSPLFCDLDNDGWKDLFITSGIYRRANDLDYIKYLTGDNRYFPTRDNSALPNRTLFEKMPLQPDVNHLLKNNGDLTFTDVTSQWSDETPDFSNGSAYADLDNDGDLDLVVNNINGPASIYRNNAEINPGHHHISVKLRGKDLNSHGTGSRVTLYYRGRQQVAEQFPTRGFSSSSEPVLHFGLGEISVIDTLVVKWPDQARETLYNVQANQQLILDQINAIHLTPDSKSDSVIFTLFSSAQITGLEFRHQEDAYMDLDREKLIPHNLSTEGPALAVGDVNGDGRDDLFVGGARGQSGRLFIQDSRGEFQKLQIPQLGMDRFSEDVDAAFFDADEDGDLDLYVVRGGNEELPGSPFLADRLLINDGSGSFKSCHRDALPYLSYNGSCVRPADFDGDGDMDLFLGSRSIPGAYGLSPVQVLLVNKGKGRFTPLPEEQTGGFQHVGMLTDASWGDMDGDGDPDLVVVGEWMRVSLFRNNRNSFTEVTEQAGLDTTSGWWNCISTVDLDQDGDLDLVAGNYGLNSMLKASTDEPVDMYVNDFDGNGTPDQIICSYNDGFSYPIASLDEMRAQIPGLKQQYPSYSAFGGKSVTNIFGPDLVNRSIKKSAVLFESCLFINQGEGTFECIRLPREAQFSPVRDLLAGDFNRDGIPDLILAGNTYSIRPSLGRQDASFGWFLPGSRSNDYEVLLPIESGLRIRGDSRKIRSLNVGENEFIISGNNDDELQILKVRNEDEQ